ncbi:MULTISPECIES: hypothetical protein [unclassified Streptomyces]|uniref:hypothetical protein n=1 Tax=unclassified Streptomyces TaxID=2593676 RepID=UPI0022509EAC|nr:hypothetical protein [Streptomyces sp. NBC_00620]MCX4974437.1 hypothetical protein [Streptomyces sp. NBC_00620]WTB41088.1 hypothetical protein OG569_25455 [Streptomyces sp. NBC_00827]WUC52166.1 hypothetical protein OG266_28965 [Streptomyces sp. NBC_00554]
MTTPTPPGVPTRPPAQWIARYFVDPPNPADLKAAQLKMAFGGGGLVLGVVLLAAGGDASFLGAVGLVVGFILGVKGWNAKRAYDAAYALAMPRPSDAEIDQLIATDAFSIVNRSLPQLGLTPADLVTPRGVTGSGGASFDDIAANSGPQSGVGGPGDNQMVVWGPAFPCNSAFGDDGRMRYSKYEFMVICPTHYLLAIYRCELDLYSGQLKSEQTHEYHYQDVVAVRTASVPLHRGGITIQPRASQRAAFARFDTVRQMQIVVSSGDRTSVTLRVSSAADVTVDSNDPLDFPQVLERVRATLREKKGGVRAPDEDLL